LLLCPLLMRADSFYWDGGDGSWASTASWTTDPTATTPDPGSVPGISDDVFFNRDDTNATQTVNLNGTQGALSITFRQANNTTLLGGGVNQTLNLGAGGMANSGGAATVTIGSATAGQNVGIVLNASQTWTNDSTGGFNVVNAVTGAP